MLQTSVEYPAKKVVGRSKLAENDKILRRRGLKHLLSEPLIRREQRLLSDLSALRHGLRTGQFLRSTSCVGYVQQKTRVWRDMERRNVVMVRYLPATGSAANSVDLTAEHEARRRERRLTLELAAIDNLWIERGKALGVAYPTRDSSHAKGPQRGKSKSRKEPRRVH